ncbi:hypothetical protein M8494_15700 [Serratia ureilytica]
MLIGLPAAASVINSVVLTSAASSRQQRRILPAACCSGWHRGEGDAPKSFANPVKRAVPANDTHLLHLPAGRWC